MPSSKNGRRASLAKRLPSSLAKSRSRPGESDLRAEALDQRELRLARRPRARRPSPARPCPARPGHGGAVVAGGGRDDGGRAPLALVLRDGRQRAAPLERAELVQRPRASGRSHGLRASAAGRPLERRGQVHSTSDIPVATSASPGAAATPVRRDERRKSGRGRRSRRPTTISGGRPAARRRRHGRGSRPEAPAFRTGPPCPWRRAARGRSCVAGRAEDLLAEPDERKDQEQLQRIRRPVDRLDDRLVQPSAHGREKHEDRRHADDRDDGDAEAHGARSARPDPARAPG